MREQSHDVGWSYSRKRRSSKTDARQPAKVLTFKHTMMALPRRPLWLSEIGDWRGCRAFAGQRARLANMPSRAREKRRAIGTVPEGRMKQTAALQVASSYIRAGMHRTCFPLVS